MHLGGEGALKMGVGISGYTKLDQELELCCLFSKHTAPLEFPLLASMCLLVLHLFFSSASIHILWPLLFIQFKTVLLVPQYFEFNDKEEYKALHDQVTLAMLLLQGFPTLIPDFLTFTLSGSQTE